MAEFKGEVINELMELASITNLKPSDVRVVEPPVEPVIDVSDEGQLTLGRFRELTANMPDDLPILVSWGLTDYYISEIYRNRLRNRLAVELTCVTLEVKR